MQHHHSKMTHTPTALNVLKAQAASSLQRSWYSVWISDLLQACEHMWSTCGAVARHFHREGPGRAKLRCLAALRRPPAPLFPTSHATWAARRVAALERPAGHLLPEMSTMKLQCIVLSRKTFCSCCLRHTRCIGCDSFPLMCEQFQIKVHLHSVTVLTRWICNVREGKITISGFPRIKTRDELKP